MPQPKPSPETTPDTGLRSFDSVPAFLAAHAPDQPVACVRPHAARAAAAAVLSAFRAVSATPYYAVKSNPSPLLLKTLLDAGYRHFDVASTVELETVAALGPQAQPAYFNPVKSRAAIADAYQHHGVRVFALDHLDELEKINQTVGAQSPLDLVVRLAVSNDGAALPLAGKFGASMFDAPALLQAARARVDRLGVSFHVGSQCMTPDAYARALRETARLVERAGVAIDIVNVGGGFPALYPGMEPPPLSAYVAAIARGLDAAPAFAGAERWFEPGRVVCADFESLLVRVELRKGDALYVSDGAYGALFDAAHWRWRFPARALRPGGELTGAPQPYRLFGPTCDAGDAMPGPFHMAADVREGDWIEFGALGAYGRTMRTPFNGFGAFTEVEMRDTPWASYHDTDYQPSDDAGIAPRARRRGRGVGEAEGRRVPT